MQRKIAACPANSNLAGHQVLVMRPEHEETFDDFRMSMLLNSSALALRPPFALEVEQHVCTILTSEPLYGVLASFDDHFFLAQDSLPKT